MKFVKVKNTILNISTTEVQFRNGDTPTTLRRIGIYSKKIQWTLRKDGLYVRNDLVNSYELIEA